MKTLTALLTLAGVAGIGYYVYKKTNEKKDDTTAYTEYKEKRSAGDRVRRASMYAVGTIKTTADKISEGIKQVKSEDMVKKGEETVEQLKDTTDGIKEQVIEATNEIKEDIKDIKNLVTSINVSPADGAFDPETEDAAEKTEDSAAAEDAEESNVIPTIDDADFNLFESVEPDEQL